jgi:hypothetical protein
MEEETQYKTPLTKFEQDFESGNKNLFLEIREIIINYPQMAELQKSIVTSFSNDNGPICNMSSKSNQIEITFLKGIKMKDKYKLLTGTGKEMRSIIISKFNEELVKYYIDQAVTINSKRKR